MDRRTLLTGFSSALGVSLGGCTSLLGPRQVKIEAISLSNLDDEPRSVEVRVKRDGTQVYRRTFDLAKKSKLGTDENPVPVVRKPWMNEPAEFDVSARLAGDEQWYRKRFPIDGRSGSCYGINIRVNPGGRVTMPNDSHAGGCS